ncbi:MAG: acylneuraminate cytidylyltransferase family protein [Magnetococcales bacterium]|nr:acylneuraminate cytidylyltransferase family protein [Magnetococcales bacterium]
MLHDRRVLAVVPARGGSKGVALKNLRLLAGRPLVAWAGECIRRSPFIDRGVVSTDHEAIAQAAEAAGLAAPFRRPEALSGDRVADFPVLEHALQTMEALDGVIYDVVLMLQPTSPLRRDRHVEGCLRKLVEEGWDAVWTLSPTDLKFHPLKQLTLGENGAMDYFDPRGAAIVARQQLHPVYHRNGVAYAVTRDCLLRQGSIKGTRTAGLVIDDPLINIDTEEDLQRGEQLLRDGLTLE